MLFHQSHLNLKTDPYDGSFYTKINLFSTCNFEKSIKSYKKTKQKRVGSP